MDTSVATPAAGVAAGGLCNLCGSGMAEVAAVAAMADGAAACSHCASTARQRVVRRIFQALPPGLLAWRRAALAPGRHGVDRRWFLAADPSSDQADFLVLDWTPPETGAAIGAALERLSARGGVYVGGDAAADPVEAVQLLKTMTAALAEQPLPCSVLAIDCADPGGAARLPGWLLLRDAADAASWQSYLQAWPDAAPLAAGRAEGLFAPLRAELAHWQAQSGDCAFWWRDDDLVEDSEALRRLAALSQRLRAPVLMAVIPFEAEPALVEATAAMPTLAFCQHGWAHVNHAAAGQPNSEFGAGREPAAAEIDLARGCARLRTLFGERFLPIMVPPWNTLAPALAARLPALGLRGLSQYLSQPRDAGLAGVVRVDTHVDIVDWGNGAGVRNPVLLVERLVAILQLRRSGQLSGPVGILSHHRVMAEGTWSFLEQLHAVTVEFSCVRWLHPRQVFHGMEEETACAA